MRITEIDSDATLDLRQRVLWPGESKEFCRVSGDESARHFGLFLETVLIGVASLYRDGDSVRLRKFAVDNVSQGEGYGSALLHFVIDSARDDGALVLWCDARETAMSFYERFGLAAEGDRFLKSDVPYFKMSREL